MTIQRWTRVGAVAKSFYTDLRGDRITDDAIEDLTQNGRLIYWPVVIGEYFLAWFADKGHLDPPSVIRDDVWVQGIDEGFANGFNLLR